MSLSLATRHDPFVTSLELAVEAAGYRSGAQFNARYDAVVWSMLTPIEQADAYLQGQAESDNFRWDQMILRQMSATRMSWSPADCWHLVPFTEAEKAAERRRFQGG